MGYFCPAQGVCNLVCFQQTAYNFVLFPLVKLSYKHPSAFFPACETLLQTTATLLHCLAKLCFVQPSSKNINTLAAGQQVVFCSRKVKGDTLNSNKFLDHQKLSQAGSSGHAHLCGWCLCSPDCSGCHARNPHSWWHPFFAQSGQLLSLLLALSHLLAYFSHLYPSYFLIWYLCWEKAFLWHLAQQGACFWLPSTMTQRY